MADKYDPLPDLALLVGAALMGRRDAVAHAERVAHGTGIGEDDSAGTVEAVLRKALGLPPPPAPVPADGASWLVVEHDPETREPKPGGLSAPAMVASVNARYTVARYKDPEWPGGLVTASFHADSGWSAWDGGVRWRLVPADAEDAGRPAGAHGQAIP